MHRAARPTASVATKKPESKSADIYSVIDNVASIVVAGSFDSAKVQSKQAIAQALKVGEQVEAGRDGAGLPGSPTPTQVNATSQRSNDPTEVVSDVPPTPEPTNRLAKLEADQAQVTFELTKEKEAAEKFVANRPRVEDEQRKADELRESIERDRAELEKVRERREAAEASEAERWAAAQAELEKLQLTHFDLTNQLQQESGKTEEQLKQREQRTAQLALRTQQLRDEVSAAREKLTTLKARTHEPPESNSDEELLTRLKSEREQLTRDIQAEKLLASQRTEQHASDQEKQKLQIAELQREVTAGIAELKQIRRARNVALPQPNTLDDQLTGLRNSRDRLRQRIDEARTELETLQAQKRSGEETTQAEIDKLKAAIEADGKQLAELESQKTALATEVEQGCSSPEVPGLRENHVRLQNQLTEAKAALEELRQRAQAAETTAQTEIEKLKAAIEADGKQLAELESQKATLASEVEQRCSSTEVSDLRENHTQLQERLIGAKAELEEVRQRAQSSESATRAEVERLKAAIEADKERLAHVDKTKEQVVAAQQEASTTDIAPLQAEHNQLLQRLAESQTELEELQSQAQSSQDDSQLEVEKLRVVIAASERQLAEINEKKTLAATLAEQTKSAPSIAPLRDSYAQVQKRITEAQAELETLRQEAQSAESAMQAEVQKLKAAIEADGKQLAEIEKQKLAISAEAKRITSLTNIDILRAERKESQKQLSAARELLGRFRAKLRSVTRKAVSEQAASVKVVGEVRANLQETRQVLETLLDGQSDEAVLKQIPTAVELTEDSPTEPPLLDFSIEKKVKAVSPVQRAVLEPYEGEEDEDEDGEYLQDYPQPEADSSYTADRGRQPGSFSMSLLSIGLGLVAIAMVAAAAGVAMWLYSGFENGTRVADALTRYLPIARQGVPVAWALGSLICLVVPRITGARLEAGVTLVCASVSLAAIYFWWNGLTPAVLTTIGVSGILYAYLLQSFVAEICSFGGFRNCEELCEKLMALTTIVMLSAAGLGIAWYVRAEPLTVFRGIQITLLGVAVLCLSNAMVLARVILNIKSEQSRGREWLLEHV